MAERGSGNGGSPAAAAGAPARAGLVLGTLILVAAVANLNLAVANVALPSIGAAFDSSQTTLNLIAVGYSLGLAASVLWLGEAEWPPAETQRRLEVIERKARLFRVRPEALA